MNERDHCLWISQRLEFMPITRLDAEDLYAGLREPVLYTFIPEDPPADANALRKRYERLESCSSPDGTQAWLNWAIRSSEDRGCLGYIQATVSKSEKRALISYVVFAPFWGKGYAQEAVAAILTRLFPKFNLEYVDALIDTRNERSIAVVEALGFKRIDLIPNADHFKGARSDEYRYRIFNYPSQLKNTS
jgi:ribosomal-protein-alanine N-acetyltransferase